MKKLLLFIAISFCFSNIILAQFSDCDKAILLCQKNALMVKELNGAGERSDELTYLSCGGELSEKNSVWLKFKAVKSGTFNFVIYPLQTNDDIDFVVFKIYDETNSCTKRKEIRCMAAGDSKTGDTKQDNRCLGVTGLSNNAVDLRETAGCDNLKDNFLSTMQIEQGETYAIAVNNYSSTNGFLIEFGGTVEFGGVPSYAAVQSDEPAEINNKLFSFDYEDKNASQEEIHDNIVAGLNFKGLHIETMIKDIEPLKISHKTAASISCINSPIKIANTNSIPIQVAGIIEGEFSVSNPFPVPTKDEVNIYLSSDAYQIIRFETIDLLGRTVDTKIEFVNKGTQKISINSTQLLSGTYFLHIFAQNKHLVKKIIKT